jgi:peptidyl-prolyl cis-trans isomerase C/foldase protein PrsA
MDEGQVSKAIKSAYGFHIFKVEERAPGRQLTFEEVAEEVKKKIAQNKSERRYYDWLEELRRDAKIKIHHHLLEYTD